ncbi:actin-interacting protein 1 [Eurytemora carolleeae]|uniref:actin-interacting protein 1 n=1 Tax=Eurytemora carolleeae TaxID=1294199 RepID=UPI000C78A498|nr:actin-interacting protein 1 [Eurytemora carolleeae]|eukprot:XP_023329890.1 actin-interacting protein 1-like [Eurytemora affinis]
MSGYSNRFTFACLPRTERGQPIVLGEDPKGENFLYCHGNSVVIRNLDSPQYSEIYTQHSTQVNVAKYSPSRFYIASADKSGKVRIWDTVNKEHILKNEFQPISGPIKDLAWSSDNQRIVVVGEGREKFGHVFLADTGTSNGDITGQTRPINTVDFKPSRPFRIVTGSEDNTAAVYEGPPFKFKATKNEHTRYCQVVRYSPDGNYWASGGFDGKIFLYDGKDSELKGELSGHTGGVYGLAWDGSGRKLLSASGDKTCRLWDIETQRCITTFNMGTQVEDQQVGCLWSGQHLISVSLSGFINYLDINNPDTPKLIIKGHNKPITAMDLSSDKKTIYTGGSDGTVTAWDPESGNNQRIGGSGHGAQIIQIKGTNTGVASIGFDDTLRGVDGGSGEYTGPAQPLSAQPRALDIKGDLTVTATLKSLVLQRGGNLMFEEKVEFEPSSVNYSTSLAHLAVGEAGGNLLRIYSVQEGGLDLVKEIQLTGAVQDLMYSPDQKYLVAADSNRKVSVYTAGSYEKPHKQEWGFHTAKVNCVAWAPNSIYVASGGLDCSIIIWSMDLPDKHCIMRNAHDQSQITRVSWLDNSSLVSTGQDGNTKIWNITWPN